MTGERPLTERVARERERHPDAGVATIAGALGAPPDAVADALNEDTPDQGGVLSKDTGGRLSGSRQRAQTDPEHGFGGGCDCPTDVCRHSPDHERAAEFGALLDCLEAEGIDVDQLRFMPVDADTKAPAIEGTARLESREADLLLHTADEAYIAICQGHAGFALYFGRDDHGTEDLVAVDVDDPETFPCESFPDTLTIQSGSGAGEHLYYRNAGDVKRAKGKDGVDGEVRARNWFVKVPGSIHPSGGVYTVTEDRPLQELAHEDIPEPLQPGTTADTDVVDLDPPEDLATATFENDFGMGLEEIRERDEKLDALLTHLEPPGYGYPSPSEADFATAGKLWFWRFDEQQIANIMRRHRRRGKIVDRDDYLATTVSKAATGERVDPDGDVAGEGDRADHAGGDPRPTSVLPLAQLDAIAPHERRRAARMRGFQWPDTDAARDALQEAINEVMRNEDDRVVDAPTALGKTHTVAATRWGAREDLTGDRPVVHLLETTDARDEAIDIAEEHGGSYHVLLGRHEACPVAAGDHDPREVAECDDEDRQEVTVDGEPASQVIDRLCDHKGLPFSVAHTLVDEHNDQDVDLPCGGDSCHAIRQWDVYREGPEGRDYWPLVIATHNFAHAPGLRMRTNLVVDEEPDYEVDLSTDRVRAAVNAYLQEIDAPVSTWEAFVQLSTYDGFGDDAANERDALEDALYQEPPQEWYFNEPDAHVLAPALARAIFHAEDRANGRQAGKTVFEPPRLEAGAREEDEWNREWVSVVLDESNDVQTVRTVPDFKAARSLIGLDAHPAEPIWQANTLPWMATKQVLEPEARRLWRRYERGLRVVQVGDATRPLSGDRALDWLDDDKLAVLLEHLVDEYGADFRTAITTAQVEDRLEELMTDAGVATPELMHFGNEKSRNDFATEAVGLVNGCMDPGDEYIVDLLAELDLEAEAETAVDDDGEEYRAKGRGFEGADAETAQAILASVRENHIAQAAGRYARDPEDPTTTATVFVRTDASPPGFADVEVPGVEWAFTDLQEDIVEDLRVHDGARTAREISEDVGCSKEHVRQTLDRLRDGDGPNVVQAVRDEGEHGATLYADTGLPHSGVVDVDEPPRTPYGTTNRWSLAIRDPDRVDPPNEVTDTSAGSNAGDESAVWDWRTTSDLE